MSTRNERRPKLETCPRIPKWIFLLNTLAFTPLALLLSTGRIRGAAGASFETRGQKEPRGLERSAERSRWTGPLRDERSESRKRARKQVGCMIAYCPLHEGRGLKHPVLRRDSSKKPTALLNGVHQVAVYLGRFAAKNRPKSASLSLCVLRGFWQLPFATRPLPDARVG